MRHESDEHGGAQYGGSRVKVRCPSCGTEISLLDRKFARHGPVRCGGCGRDVRDATIRSARSQPSTNEPGGH